MSENNVGRPIELLDIMTLEETREYHRRRRRKNLRSHASLIPGMLRLIRQQERELRRKSGRIHCRIDRNWIHQETLRRLRSLQG